MFVADPGRGAIYVGASDDRGSFAGAGFNALPLQNLMLPWAVAFDNRSRTVFWTDGDLDAILRANIDGTEQRVIVDGLGYPAGLAIDTANNKLYWTDYELHEIASSTLQGKERKVLVKTGLQRPRGITVSACYCLLFWADESANTIERVNTDGSNRMVLVSCGLDYPTAVSLNNEENRLYWADFGRGRVESVEINGGDRRAHVEMVKGFTFIKPYGLALLGKENKIFYSDYTQSVILEIDQSQGSEREPITIEGATDQFQDLTHIFISEFSEEGLASSFLPTSTLIIIIAGSSVIGILAIILMIALGIKTSRARASSVDKGTTESSNHNQDSLQTNDTPSPPSDVGLPVRVPSYLEPNQVHPNRYCTLDTKDAPHEYEEPDGIDAVGVPHRLQQILPNTFDVPSDAPHEYEEPDGIDMSEYMNVDRDKGRPVVDDGEYVKMHGLELQHTYSN
eukprot:XP_011674471.1 PREDICTED: low-density lipoprotein receptor-related protein 4 [Strongylocentrotus purpuratus]